MNSTDFYFCNKRLWKKWYDKHFNRKEKDMKTKEVRSGVHDEQDLHKLHTHPRLESQYGLSGIYVIIDYQEYVKAKDREHKDCPPFTATPEDYYKERLREQSNTIGILQTRDRELRDEVLRLEKRLKPTPPTQYEHTKRELKHYKERYFQQIETIRDYQKETNQYKQRLDSFDKSIEAKRVTIEEYRKECSRMAEVMNVQACQLATAEAKSEDFKKLLDTTVTQRDYHQERCEGYKKHLRTASSTIESLKTTARDGMNHFKETYYKARIKDLEAQIERECAKKEYCGDEEIRPMFANSEGDHFKFINVCPECRTVSWTSKAYTEGQVCDKCHVKTETPEDDEMTDDEVHKIVWSGCESYTVSMVNYNKIKQAVKEARGTLEDQGKFRFWPIIKCNEPKTDKPVTQGVKNIFDEIAKTYSKPELAAIYPYRGRCPKCKRDTYCGRVDQINDECYECQTGRKEENKGSDLKQATDMAEDLIKSPNHYNWHPTGVECKDIVKEFIYNKGTAIAYIWRSEHKGTEKADIQKAVQHLQFELERIKGNDSTK